MYMHFKKRPLINIAQKLSRKFIYYFAIKLAQDFKDTFKSSLKIHK